MADHTTIGGRAISRSYTFDLENSSVFTRVAQHDVPPHTGSGTGPPRKLAHGDTGHGTRHSHATAARVPRLSHQTTAANG